MSDWINVEKELPDVELGGELHCFVVLEVKYSGKLFVRDAYYVNKPDMGENEEEDYPDWTLYTEDGELYPLVGWANKTHHPDYNGFYEGVDTSYYNVLAWQPVIYPRLSLEDYNE